MQCKRNIIGISAVTFELQSKVPCAEETNLSVFSTEAGNKK